MRSILRAHGPYVLVLPILLAAAPLLAITWTHDPGATAGDDFNVQITGSPTWPVTIRFYIDNELVQTTRVSSSDARATYTVPTGTEGSTLTVTVTNGTDSDSWDCTIN